LQRKYRELIHKHLSHVLDRLFAEFTGLHIHVAWMLTSPKGRDVRSLPTGCSVCCKLSGSPLHPECRLCGSHHLAITLGSKRGHRFTCHFGVRNYWLPIRVRNETLGIAYLQALEHSPHKPPARNRSSDGAHARFGQREALVKSRLEFARAARFLGHIVQYVETASVSDLRRADLSSAGRAVVALEREQARLHETLRRYLPAAAAAPRSSPESHAEQVVHALVQRIELDYAKPLTLKRLARDQRMNAAYLSALFSRAVGIPFKAFLTELRLHKAKELLGDSGKTASEVAFSVGYSSEERFRSAFKKATGLSPKIWRQTMQTIPAGPLV
jgi:AraC-like DNA-binding protein